jgi:radical SAM protein with 4Fe4S-binding SPASM domain
MPLNLQGVEIITADDITSWTAEILRSARVPVTGCIELTWRCNLACVHCYLPERARAELETATWLRIIDEIADAGTLFLTITGGEAMLRKDFAEIYSHAVQKGLFVIVFTNGVLVNDESIELFRRYPPYKVEVSLYGASSETYREVAKNASAYEKVKAGVQRLHDAGIHVILKSMIMHGLLNDLPYIRSYASETGMHLRTDPVVNPRLNHDRKPLSLRVLPPAAVSAEQESPAQFAELKMFAERRCGTRHDERVFQCGAGRSYFTVDPEGRLQMCNMVRDPAYDVAAGSFAEGWALFEEELASKLPRGHRCIDCTLREICSQCPGTAVVESGDKTAVVEYVCQLTRERAQNMGIPTEGWGGWSV